MEHIEINEVLSRLKNILNIKKDIELAIFLDIDPDILSAWKKNNSVNYKYLINQCLLNGIKLDKVFNVQRQNIIQATFELFIEKGHAESSVEFIAQKVGFSKEIVHKYYDNKLVLTKKS